MRELPRDLEAAIATSVDDPAGYRVAADWLEQQGDPHGERIALAIEADDARPGAAPLDEPVAELDWRWGFVRGVHVGWIADAGDVTRVLDALAMPVTRFVRELRVSPLVGGTGIARRLVGGLVELARGETAVLRSVRSIALHVEDDDRRPIDIGAIAARACGLVRAELRIPRMTGVVDLPRLDELSIASADAIELIRTARLPALRILRVHAEAVPDLDAWLDPEQLPALRVLSIAHGSGHESGWVRPHTAIASQLDRFDVISIGRRSVTRYYEVDRAPGSERAGLLALHGCRAPAPGTLVALEPRDGQFVVGRIADADLVLPSARVGRRHARLFAARGRWHVDHLGSTNGTRVNGIESGQVGRIELRSGDDVVFADVPFRFIEDADLDRVARELRAREAM